MTDYIDRYLKNSDLNSWEFYQPLFDLMDNEHNLILLEGEMDEIIHMVIKMLKSEAKEL
ncbi:MAG: hypothetical protein ACK50L_02450 [Bacteroidota bacterium]